MKTLTHLKLRLAKTSCMILALTSLPAFSAEPAAETKPVPPAAVEGNAPVRRQRGQLNPPGADQPGNFPGAQGGRGGGAAGFGGGINLDEKQRELLREAQQSDNDALRKLNDQLAAAQKEFVHVVVAEKYDEKVVREKAEAVARLQTEIALLRAREFATVSPTLKPEQREQIEGARFSYGFITGAGLSFGGAPAMGGNFIGGRGGPADAAPNGGNFRRNGNDRGPRGDQGGPDTNRRRGGQNAGPGQ